MSQQLSFIAPQIPPPAMMMKAKAKPKGPPPEIDEELFAAFWLAYPKRPNNSKFEARKSWGRALRHATPTEIMDGMARYEFSPDPRMRPMAATFLNQQRWACINDDLDVDAYGLAEWLADLPHDGTLSAACYDIDDLRPILIATGWEPSWRGSLDIVNAWMRDGYVPDSVAKIVAGAVAEHGARGNLAAFDKRVRYRAERISS